MTTSLLLRAAASLAALQGLAHGFLFITAKPRHGAAETAVITAMKVNRIFPGGLGYWDYYFGYGLIAAAACLVEAVLFWQFANIATSQPLLVRPSIALFVVANVGHALVLVRYFKFPLPIAFDLVIAAVLLAAAFAVNAVSTTGLAPSA